MEVEEETVVTIDLSEYRKDTIDKLKIAIMTTSMLMAAVIVLGCLILYVDGRVILTEENEVKEMPEQWAVLVAGSKG